MILVLIIIIIIIIIMVIIMVIMTIIIIMGQIVTLKTIYLKLADLGLVAGEICFLIIVVWF